MWLDEKYLNQISSALHLFKKKRNGLYNCRCPFCGDSKKDKTKARGYFYTKDNKMYYRCHNCGESCTFASFLYQFDEPTYRDYKLDLWKESGSPRKKVIDTDKSAYKKVAKKKNTTSYSDLERISDLPNNHIAKKYLLERKIPSNFFQKLFYVKNIGIISSKIEKYKNMKYDDVPRIIIPFLDEEKNLTHIAGRAIEKSNLRYITLVIDEDKPKIFGLDAIDKTKHIYVTEGQFDSMFLPNALAMGGSDLQNSASYLDVDPDQITIIPDNEPRNKEIIKMVEKCIDIGYNVCLPPKIKNGLKDLNLLVIAGVDVYEMVKTYSYRNLNAKLRLAKWKKI